MTTIRLMTPPIAKTVAVNGRSYSSTPGAVQDIPDFDALVLEANGWSHVAQSGPTANRPAGGLGPYPAAPGVEYFDTTINALIKFDGAMWRSPVDGSAV